MTPAQINALNHDWRFWARPKQLAPDGDWDCWLVMAGRGFGKSRTGAEWCKQEVTPPNFSIMAGKRGRLALVARTAADVRDVMIEGPSGILTRAHPLFKPEYEPSKRRVTWPNGAVAIAYSADEPDALRGPEHDGAWADERAAWRYDDAWDQLQFGLRLGTDPRVVVTTTPRPTKAIRELASDPRTVLTTGTTYENVANLAPVFMRKVVAKYEGTRLGRQELLAEILTDVPGALWRRANIELLRVKQMPPLVRIVVAIDPQAADPNATDDDTAETGIVVAGVGIDGHGYVLDDLSLSGLPSEWGLAAVGGFDKYQGDLVVGEINNGGAMVGHVIYTTRANVPFKAVTASRGKLTRAEPVSALYDKGLVHHVGMFAELEDQMCTWLPGAKSPDRMDALVWALTELFFGEVEYGHEDDTDEQISSY